MPDRPIRALALLLAAVAASACAGAPREVEAVGEPVLYSGRVVASRGPTMARDGGRCTIEVQRADGSFLNCRIRIRCNDDLVYGLSGAGFNHCRTEGDVFVFAHDTSGTRRDGDPRMFFDLAAGRVIISDDDPDVEVLVDLMTSPPRYPGDDDADDDPGGDSGGDSGGEAIDEPDEDAEDLGGQPLSPLR